jgi:hypothetical protein
VQSAFVIVVIAVAAVGVLGAVLALLGSRGTWETLGRDRLLMESDLRDPRHGARAGAARAPSARAREDAERDTEIRQMLQARNARRRRRGEPALDIEAELRRLTAPIPEPGAGSTAIDAELRGEIRELVVARNHRRVRRGRPPLGVDVEIEREIARLNG